MIEAFLTAFGYVFGAVFGLCFGVLGSILLFFAIIITLFMIADKKK